MKIFDDVEGRCCFKGGVDFDFQQKNKVWFFIFLSCLYLVYRTTFQRI